MTNIIFQRVKAYLNGSGHVTVYISHVKMSHEIKTVCAVIYSCPLYEIRENQQNSFRHFKLIFDHKRSKAPATNVWQAVTALVKPKAYDYYTRNETFRIGHSG